jgi:hypothetical protein
MKVEKITESDFLELIKEGDKLEKKLQRKRLARRTSSQEEEIPEKSTTEEPSVEA